MARTLVTLTTSWQDLGVGPMLISVAEVGDGQLYVNGAQVDNTAIKITRPKGMEQIQFDCRAAINYYAKATKSGWKIITDTDT